MRVSVEVCVTSVEEALAAEQVGADSVELCSWLASGGVTPSYGLVNTLKELLKIPLRVLIRPTPGGFLYGPHQRQAILRDGLLIGMSKVGLVAGALDERGLPDASLMKAVRLAASDNEITFHRAIDRSADLGRAFALCLEMNVQRVLTSGGRTLAMDGARVIKAMVDGAKERLLVAAAGGITPANVVALVQRTGITEVHFSAQRSRPGEPHLVAMSSSHRAESFEVEPDTAKIEGVLNALVKAGLR